ncbi:SulP family inorganic anion transporter [Aquimarina sp. ERC-38]|uniref:SulP family inorganic anion transporter n=1 Tax=Aquimarina sp. ERC-38 TaxID=2949996 RepID=UPI002245D792|nr:SulP family inorganic anion transporter [Aquimarina sp. ERC-38]UZO81696.1 SulP family inorganic anion transporter [Aquimarina sp. ERC-38]
MKGLFSNLKGDFFGGLTAGIVALPLALAFGVSSGLGPSAGLYGAIFIGLFAAIFGGTATQISGPTAPMTAVSTLVIAGIIAANEGDIEKALPAILTIFLVAGLIQIGLGAVGIGKYIKFMPQPVVSGFMTAIGIMILITQILPAIGYYPKEDTELINNYLPQGEERILNRTIKEENIDNIFVVEDLRKTLSQTENINPDEILKEAKSVAAAKTSGVLGTLKILPRSIQYINWLELILCLATILIIYGFKRVTTAIPSTLVALILVSGVAYFMNLEYRPIQEIPGGFPVPNVSIFTNFDFGLISPYLLTSLSLAFLGSIDSLLTSVIADNMTKTRHQPNRELVGQGIGNSVAALFGGIPGAGATIRTVVNINAGGRTKLSGIIAGLLLLVILLALGPVASQIPAAVLAGILITVGFGVMDYKGLKAIPHMPKIEVAIMLIVLILSVFWNLVYAVGVGLVLAALVFMKKMGDYTATASKINRLHDLNEDLWTDEKSLPNHLREDIVIKHLNGPLFFGASKEIQVLASQIPEKVAAVIIRMDNVPYMDQSGLYVLEEILFSLKQKEVLTYIIGLQQQPRYMMTSIDIIPDLVSDERIFQNFDECLSTIQLQVQSVK